MKRQLAATLIVFVAPFLFVACVSSILKEAPPTFSREINLKDPAAPFVRMKTSVFPSWKSKTSGNVISVVSDCDRNSPQALSQLHRIVEDSLTSIEVIAEEGAFLHEKPALSKNIKAELDGSPIEVLSLSFKRKSCGYVTSLSGKIGTLTQDRAVFDQFNQGLTFE